ncbi:MAG: maltooligosyltrehalose trehalohydrolase [Pirellulaceae bacterium]|jgi:maltooligosyltrehalose trehalohydrolase
MPETESADTSRDDSRDRLGATPIGPKTTRFRVWAPKRKTVGVEIEGENGAMLHPLAKEVGGYFVGIVEGAGPGDCYRYRLDGNASRPDPASRFQPQGVHGPSQVVAADAFNWGDHEYLGVEKSDLVIYELHVGAFTRQGTYLAACERIAELKEIGFTAIELLPVAQSPGKWNWGYDGVNLYAPRNTFGAPDDLRTFIDACHAEGIAVLLDVVYNHLGPEGNYLSEFAPYFSRKHDTPWGGAFGYDDRNGKHISRYIVENVIHWLQEYHFDGLRFDAIHFMFDDREETILDEICDAVEEYEKTIKRRIHLIAEANVYDHELLHRKQKHQRAYDAMWCDCLMHSIYSHAVPDLNLTHRDYKGTYDIADALRFGYLYTGPEVTRADLNTAPTVGDNSHLDSLVVALQTHDSVGNHPHGKRLHHLTSFEYQKAAAALVLLYPAIPLVFMGEERAIDAPFPFFVDFEDQGLRRAVDRGRANEYPQHEWSGALRPSDPQAFHKAKCHDPDKWNTDVLNWYKSLLHLRHEFRKAGQLDASQLRVAYDETTHLFTLSYDNERALTVYSRLCIDNSPPVALKLDGKLRLNSQSDTQPESGVILLAANQAIVTTK